VARPSVLIIVRDVARDPTEFISKLEGGLQELEESGYWLELLVEGGFVPEERLADLRRKQTS
jgi:hypothetical protein